jgi:hypothetical protein
MYKVTYTIKNEDGFLVDKVKKFDVMQDACKFIRELVNRSGSASIVGRPTVERA